MDVSTPFSKPFGAIEVRFKNGRKDFFDNIHALELFTGDPVMVECGGGYHLGYVSLQGEIVRLQMRKKKVEEDPAGLEKINRKATQKDLKKYHQLREKELSTLYKSREIIRSLELKMKLSDIEYQADGGKITFYYSAEDRVDFRALIKELASEFKVRVEMRQISLRNEAGRLGGIGSCGRELCCSTWLTDFKSVSTSAARYQSLSLNPTKLSGQCGRLKCCLNYELDSYMESLKNLPKVTKPLKTEQGEAILQKTDIFKAQMWFSYKNNAQSWIQVSAERVAEVQEMNKNGQIPPSLSEEEEQKVRFEEQEAVQEIEELEALDKKLAKIEDKTKRQQKKKRNQGKSSNSNQRKEPQSKSTNKPTSARRKRKNVKNNKPSQPPKQGPKNNNE